MGFVSTMIDLILNPKVLLALCVAFLLWLLASILQDVGYAKGYAAAQREAASRIETLTKERDEFEVKYRAERETAANAKAAYERALREQKTASEQVAHDLQKKLDAEKAKKAKVITIIKEVDRYVTPNADAGCTLTAGFEWLHDAAINPDLADRPPGDVDAPAGIAVSEAAVTIANNLSECRARGEMIEAWQSWYEKNLAIFEKAAEDSKKYEAVTPKNY